MLPTKTALYRASLLTDNVASGSAIAEFLVMPSALVFWRRFGLLDGAGDELLAFGPPRRRLGPPRWSARRCASASRCLDADPQPGTAAGAKAGAARASSSPRCWSAP
jgi:hypothetical protein